MNEKISYSISAGLKYDGKSVCIWREKGNVFSKVARFTSAEEALLFADGFGWPLSDQTHAELKALLKGE